MRSVLFLVTILLLVPQAHGQVVRGNTARHFPDRIDFVQGEHGLLSPDMERNLSESRTIDQLQSLDDAIQRKQIEEAISQARTAYESAAVQHGSESIKTAEAGFDYGYLLSEVRLDEEAQAVLVPVIATLQTAGPEYRLLLAKAYLGLARVANRINQREYADKALEIFDSSQGLKELELANYREKAASILIDFPENRARAETLFLLLMPVYEEHYGANSEQMITVLIAYAESLRRRGVFNYAWRRTSNFKKALKIARTHEDPVVYADASFAIGTSLLYRSYSFNGGKYTKKALAIYKQELGDKHIKTGAALQNMGFYHQLGGRSKTANHFFLEALEVFRSDENFRNYEIKTLVQIVRNYERINQRDKSTPYCRAIGEISPWISDQTPKLLYRKRVARWPRFETGIVTVEFNIDQDGLVQNAKITQSGVNKTTDLAVLKAINGYRYSPKFENGVAVTSHNHSESFKFKRH